MVGDYDVPSTMLQRTLHGFFAVDDLIVRVYSTLLQLSQEKKHIVFRVFYQEHLHAVVYFNHWRYLVKAGELSLLSGLYLPSANTGQVWPFGLKIHYNQSTF